MIAIERNAKPLPIQKLLMTKKLADIAPAIPYALRSFDHVSLSILIKDYGMDILSIDIDGMNALQFLLQDHKLTKKKALTIKFVRDSAQWDLDNVIDGFSYNDLIMEKFLANPFLFHVLGSKASPIRKSMSWAEFANILLASMKIKHYGWFIETLRYFEEEMKDELEKDSRRADDPELIVFRNFLTRLANILKSPDHSFGDRPKLTGYLQVLDTSGRVDEIYNAIIHLEKIWRILLHFSLI